MKFGQISVQTIKHISNLFLDWQLVPGPSFHDLDKMTIKYDMFFSWSLLFLSVSVGTFKRAKNHKLIIFGFWLMR